MLCGLELKDKNSGPDKGRHISTERSWSQETCSQALFINAQPNTRELGPHPALIQGGSILACFLSNRWIIL